MISLDQLMNSDQLRKSFEQVADFMFLTNDIRHVSDVDFVNSPSCCNPS